MIGVWSKWVGMIVYNDVEMNRRERKSGIRSEWVGDEFGVMSVSVI